MLSGWRAFLELCQDPHFRRIVLVESPNVLCRERWNDSPVTLAAAGQLSATKKGAIHASRRLVARMLMGALAEAALVIAESDDRERSSREADAIVTRFIGALSRKGVESMKTLKDRVAVVTGAGGGLGRPLAQELSSRGFDLALVDVNSEAVLKNKLRVRVGRDAMLLDWLERLLPVGIHRPMLRLARQQLAALQPRSESREGGKG